MNTKTLALTAAVLLIAAPAAAQELTLEPETFEKDVVAGETIEENLSISWSGDFPVVAQLSADYKTSNGDDASEGFTTNFSSNPVAVYHTDSTNVDVVIETHPALNEDSYSITLEAKTELQDTSSDDSGSSGGSGGSGSTSSLVLNTSTGETIDRDGVLSLQETIDKLKEEREGLNNRIDKLEDDHDIMRDEIHNLVDERNNLNQTIDSLERQKQQLEQEKQRNTWIGTVAGVFASIMILLLIYLLYRSELVSQKIRGMKGNNEFISDFWDAENDDDKKGL